MTVDHLLNALRSLSDRGMGDLPVVFDAGAYRKHPEVGLVLIEFTLRTPFVKGQRVEACDAPLTLNDMVELL